MAFRGKSMEEWDEKDVQDFFQSLPSLADDFREAVMTVCAKFQVSGEDLVGEEAAKELLAVGVPEPVVAMMMEEVEQHKDSFPEEGEEDPDPMFELTYETGEGKQHKLGVKASDSVKGLKQEIAHNEHYGDYKAVRLVYLGAPMVDNKTLREHNLTSTAAALTVSVVFMTKGGAQPGAVDDDDEDPMFAMLLRHHRMLVARATMPSSLWESDDDEAAEEPADAWLHRLPAALLKEVPVLLDRELLPEKAMLAMSDEGWARVIPKALFRRKFLKGLKTQRRRMERRVALGTKRTLPKKHPLVKKTMKADVVPGTEDADAFFRAEMPCRHAIGPNNLFRYFYMELMDKMGTTTLKCPKHTCKQEWPWHVVFAVCGLGPEEAATYQRVIDRNVLDKSTRACPHCRTRCDKPASITHCRVRCVSCHGRDFCWECGRAWASGGFQQCGNKDCDITERLNKILKQCHAKEFEQYGVQCPSIRMCPRDGCKTLVEHTRACKHMTCPSCKKEFCFFCLALKTDAGRWPCTTGDGAYKTCKVARRQRVAA